MERASARPSSVTSPLSASSSRSHWQTLRDLLPYLWPRQSPSLRLRVAVALFCLVLAKLALVGVPLLFKTAVDALSPPEGLTLPLGILLAYGGARLASSVFSELRDVLFAKVAQRAIRHVALAIFRHLHGLSLAFHLERQTGGLTRAIDRGTKAIETLLNFALFAILPTFLELLFSTVVLWWLYGLEMAAITFLTVTLYAGYTWRVTEWRLAMRRRMNESDQRASTRAIDSLLNFETVKYFGNEEHEAKRLDEGLSAYEAAAVASRASLSVLNIGQVTIIAFGVTLLMALAAWRVTQGGLTLGDFVAVNAYMMQLAQPLNIFGFVYREVKQALTDMESLFALRLVAPGIQDLPGARPLRLEGGAVRFANVFFRYHAERAILRGVSFEVPAGRTLAVVGASGAGKSTLSRLLFRFYDPEAGAILIDGQDLRQVTQASLRAAIGIVPQDSVLFNDTLGYNLLYGRPEASEEELAEALRIAGLDGFVASLPEGLETRVGERGLKLSGGEKQRVAIARVVLKRPAIFLFDEATSALDTKIERRILASLRQASLGHTTLIIAHRLSTVVDADTIIVLDQGRVAESGTHAELLAQGGLYAEMWRRQQRPENRQESPQEELVP